MAALDSNALLAETADLWVGDDSGSLVDLGAVRNVRFMGELIRTKIDSDNRGTILNKVRMQGKIEFDWLEPGNAAKLAELFKGIVTPGTVAGSIVNNYSQVEAANGSGRSRRQVGPVGHGRSVDDIGWAIDGGPRRLLAGEDPEAHPNAGAQVPEHIEAAPAVAP